MLKTIDKNQEGERWEQEIIEEQNQTIRKIGNDEIEKLFVPINTWWGRNISDVLKEIVQYVHKLLKKVRFENEYLDKHFGKLSARELLSRGKTFYMNPCLDFVLVTIEWLKRTGIDNIQFIAEELKCPWDLFKVHFGIEIEHQTKKYYIDYRGKNDVFLGEGNFRSKYEKKWEKIINSIRVNAKDISVDDNIYSLMEKWVIKFKKFNSSWLEQLTEKIKKHNVPEQRQHNLAGVKNIEEAEIFLEDNE